LRSDDLVSIGGPYTVDRVRQQPWPSIVDTDPARKAIAAIKSAMVERQV
jgi:hypothetical protein